MEIHGIGSSAKGLVHINQHAFELVATSDQINVNNLYYAGLYLLELQERIEDDETIPTLELKHMSVVKGKVQAHWENLAPHQKQDLEDLKPMRKRKTNRNAFSLINNNNNPPTPQQYYEKGEVPENIDALYNVLMFIFINKKHLGANSSKTDKFIHAMRENWEQFSVNQKQILQIRMKQVLKLDDENEGGCGRILFYGAAALFTLYLSYRGGKALYQWYRGTAQ